MTTVGPDAAPTPPDLLPPWQRAAPLRITVYKYPQPNGALDRPVGSDDVDDWVAPWSASRDALYPDDWADAWVPSRDALYPDDWSDPATAQGDAIGVDASVVPRSFDGASGSSASSDPVDAPDSGFAASIAEPMKIAVPPLLARVLLSPSVAQVRAPTLASAVPAGNWPANQAQPPVDFSMQGVSSLGAPTGPTSITLPLGSGDDASSSADQAAARGLSSADAQGDRGPPRQPDTDWLNLNGHWIWHILDALSPIGTAQAQEDEGEPLPPAVIESLSRFRPREEVERLLENRRLFLRNYRAMHDLAEAEDRKRSRAILGRRMERAGIPRPDGYEAHHIVARNDKRAAGSRKILEKFGIDINDPENGVFLPPDKSSPRVADEMPHRTVHSNRYYEVLCDAPRQAGTKQDVINTLTAIGALLQFGGDP